MKTTKEIIDKEYFINLVANDYGTFHKYNTVSIKKELIKAHLNIIISQTLEEKDKEIERLNQLIK